MAGPDPRRARAVGAAVTGYRKLIAYVIGVGATVAVSMITHGGSVQYIPAALGAFSVWYLRNGPDDAPPQ